MTGFDYGNARLRALRSRMLSRDDLLDLVNADGLDRLLGSLAETTYGPDVQAALVRFSGLRCLDEAVRTHLARSLRMLEKLFDGEDRARLQLILHRWDLRNLRTIVRGRIRLEGSERIIGLLVPAGTIDESALRELAAQPGLRAALELMVAWNLPSPGTASRLVSVWPEYEAGDDPTVFERELNRAYADVLHSELAGGPDDELARILRIEIDLINLLTALRLRRAALDDEPGWDVEDPAGHYLPAGRLPIDLLELVRIAEDAGEVTEILKGGPVLPDWTAALKRWTDEEDLVTLAHDLEDATFRFAIGMFSSGDPLGIAIPVAFAWAKENEARNLRLIARGIVHAIPADVIEEELLVA